VSGVQQQPPQPSVAQMIVNSIHRLETKVDNQAAALQRLEAQNPTQIVSELKGAVVSINSTVRKLGERTMQLEAITADLRQQVHIAPDSIDQRLIAVERELRDRRAHTAGQGSVLRTLGIGMTWLLDYGWKIGAIIVGANYGYGLIEQRVVMGHEPRARVTISEPLDGGGIRP